MRVDIILLYDLRTLKKKDKIKLMTFCPQRSFLFFHIPFLFTIRRRCVKRTYFQDTSLSTLLLRLPDYKAQTTLIYFSMGPNCFHCCKSIPWENSHHFTTGQLVPCEMTPGKRAQKFYTDDASLPRSFTNLIMTRAYVSLKISCSISTI